MNRAEALEAVALWEADLVAEQEWLNRLSSLKERLARGMACELAVLAFFDMYAERMRRVTGAQRDHLQRMRQMVDAD